MHRPIGILVAVLLLTSCAPTDLAGLQQDLTLAARERVEKILAKRLTDELGKRIDLVISRLAEPGGYLDNPLVRILLPPPIGLVLDVSRDLSGNPEADLLKTLMNRAAEQAIPGAAPILREAVAQITSDQAKILLEGDSMAVTRYLKTKTEDIVRNTLMSAVATTLSDTGARLVYSELLEAYMGPSLSPGTDAIRPEVVTSENLEGYVTDQAVAGLFKAIGEQEIDIRENIEQSAGSLLQGLGRNPEDGAADKP